jgi:signal peptidase I
VLRTACPREWTAEVEWSRPGPDRPLARPLASPLARRFVRELVRGMVAVILLHLFVIQISVVRGHSMQPCLSDGDRLVVDRLIYSLGDVQRFDVVVMRNPRDEEVDYVKRVVGLPGDRVRLRRGQLTVNGRNVTEAFGPIADDATTAVVEVPPDQYFVLGDNRPVSCDSREFGLVPGELLKGKVRARFWPLDRLTIF